MYIWSLPEWPEFRWDEAKLATPLADARYKQGLLMGQMQRLGFELREEATLETLTQDVIKTSEIEGEKLDLDQVKSSLARRLGMDIGGIAPIDRNVEGIVEVMLDATREFEKPLTKERLFKWHAALFSTGQSGLSKIRVGAWRDDRKGPMEVVSGPIGKERVHFSAPPAEQIDAEISRFVLWFEDKTNLDPVLGAGISHLWFVTIHPFEDGNGRIARAIADMALARSENSSQRFYSMSSQILNERSAYYGKLEQTQKGTIDITNWLEWFLSCFAHAIDGAQETLESIIFKAKFWTAHQGETFNERQQNLLNQILDGFEGKLTSSKWARIAKCSQDTAHRDILDLIGRKILEKNPGGGRSTSYSLRNIEAQYMVVREEP